MAAERLIYKVNGVNTSFSEMMALPNKPAGHHLLAAVVQQRGPGYPAAHLRTSVAPRRRCTVTIGGAEMQGSPFNLAAGESTRKSFAGDQRRTGEDREHPEHRGSGAADLQGQWRQHQLHGDDGAAEQPAGHHLLAALVQQRGPGYPAAVCQRQQLTGDGARVTIGGVEMPGSPSTWLPGESTRKSFAGVNTGPVQIVSNVTDRGGGAVDLQGQQRRHQLLRDDGAAGTQLDTIYWLPWYNNVDLDTQLRFGVP